MIEFRERVVSNRWFKAGQVAHILGQLGIGPENPANTLVIGLADRSRN